MVSESFYFRIKRMEENEKRWNELFQTYSEKLLRELPDIVFGYVPRAAERRDEIGDKLQEIIKKYIREGWDCFELAYHINFQQEEVGSILAIPAPISREESEKVLQSRLLKIPKEDHEIYSTIHWDTFNRSKHSDDYLFAVYQKFKEAIAESYGEYIVDFSGDCIRRLDSDIYHDCACWFVEDVYGLTPRPPRTPRQGKPESDNG